MEILNVLVAAAASYAFGAFWYMRLAKQWVAAAGVEVDPNGRPVNGSSPMPYVISGICMIVVAGMMRHIFAMSGLDTVGEGFMGGSGLGAFIALPWMITNYTYSMRPRALFLIDGAYTVIGCTLMGLVLTLF